MTKTKQTCCKCESNNWAAIVYLILNKPGKLKAFHTEKCSKKWQVYLNASCLKIQPFLKHNLYYFKNTKIQSTRLVFRKCGDLSICLKSKENVKSMLTNSISWIIYIQILVQIRLIGSSLTKTLESTLYHWRWDTV